VPALVQFDERKIRTTPAATGGRPYPFE